MRARGDAGCAPPSSPEDVIARDLDSLATLKTSLRDMRTRPKFALAVVLTTLLCGAYALAVGDSARDRVQPDRVTLLNGKKYEGHVVAMDAETVVLRVKKKELSFERDKIETVQTAVESLSVALEKYPVLPEGSAGAALEVAEDLAERNLPLESDLLAWTALLQDPSNDAANEMLGHTKRSSGWFIKSGGRFYKFRDLLEHCQDWKHAWRFSTTHFEFVSDLPLEQTLRYCWQAEQVYESVMQLFGEEWGILRSTEPLHIWLHRTPDSFPNGVQTIVNHEYTERRIDLKTWEMESDQYFRWVADHTLWGAFESMDSKASLPSFMDSAIPRYISLVLESTGRLAPAEIARDPYHFGVHVGAEKPYGIKRILGFDSSDLLGVAADDLKVAQSYTFTHFLLHGAEGVHREGLAAYVRQSLAGKRSSSYFKKSLGIKKEKELEDAYANHVGM